MPSPWTVLPVLRHVRRSLAGDVSLSAVSRLAGWSPWHLYRAVRATAGETLKQYTLRLRLEHAASQLLSTDASILTVALDAGFRGPEVFNRAFRRHFGRTPSQYRDGPGRDVAATLRKRHAELTASIGPCIHLFGVAPPAARGTSMPPLSIVRETRAPQPMLFVRRRAARPEIAAVLAECFGKTYGHCQQAGLPLAGRPTARYFVSGPGLFTIEAGTPLAVAAAGTGEIEAGELPGGPIAVAVHAGRYDDLPATHAAIERWIEQQGYRAAGAPWESYLTDPVEHPDPADWRTEVCWPIAP